MVLRSPFAEIKAFEPEAGPLTGELLPLRYAHYRMPTKCLNCGTSTIESKSFMVLAHPRRVDVGRMSAVNALTMNLPQTVHNLPVRTLPTCYNCFDESLGYTPLDLSHLPKPVEAPAWADAVARAAARDSAQRAKNETGAAAARTKQTPSLADI